MPLTSKEVAEREGFTVKRLQALVRQGRVTGVRRNSRGDLVFRSDYRIKPSAVRGRVAGKTARE